MNMYCIECPNGCFMEIKEYDGKITVTGNKCKKGYIYALQEITAPMRTVCSTVKTCFRNIPRLPVRTSGSIPKEKIFEVINEINKITVSENVSIGDIIINNVLNTGVDIIATSNTYES